MNPEGAAAAGSQPTAHRFLPEGRAQQHTFMAVQEPPVPAHSSCSLMNLAQDGKSQSALSRGEACYKSPPYILEFFPDLPPTPK